MSPDTTQILAGGALALVIIEKVFTFVWPIIRPANGNGKAELAGFQNKNYWILEFSRICKDAVIPVCDMLIRIEQNQVEILRLLRNLRAAQKRNFDDEFE